jgi:hypothetical protein
VGCDGGSGFHAIESHSFALAELPRLGLRIGSQWR